IAGFAGILFTSLAGNDSFTSISIGDGYIFLCMVAQAISFILIGRLNTTFDPRLLTGYMLVSGSVVIFMVGLWLEQDLAQISKLFSWILGSIILFSAVISTAEVHMIYNCVIKNVMTAEHNVIFHLTLLLDMIYFARFFLH